LGLNKTDWVFLGSVFYGIIIVMLSVIPITSNVEQKTDVINDDRLNIDFHLISNIQELPFWVNAFIFSPLIITFGYLLITTLLGFFFSGGS
jgi:hypothetical protein